MEQGCLIEKTIKWKKSFDQIIFDNLSSCFDFNQMVERRLNDVQQR